MATRGAPIGNQNAAKSKRWEAAIERALAAWPDPPDSEGCTDFTRGINQAAHQFVGKMMREDDLGFYKEFGDRIDGKPKQSVDATLANPDGTGLFEKAVLEVVAVDERK